MATTYTQREYTESDAVKNWREQMEAQAAQKPADYTSQWQSQMESALNDYLNRKDFSYDVNGDALYQQYKDRYVNLGQQAMMDTMGQAAKLTGGYGNSYAQMAGQQAYQSYLQGLTDKIPELYQLAYDRYNQQGQDLLNKYNLMGTQESQDYSRYMDALSSYLTERDYLAGRYDTERGYDYGVYRDTVSDDQWKANFDEDIRRFDYANKLGEFAPVASSGGSSGTTYTYKPSPDTDDETNLYYEAAKAAQAGGMQAAIDYIASQPATNEEKNIALQNAQGVAMTQHYQKLMNSYYNK